MTKQAKPSKRSAPKGKRAAAIATRAKPKSRAQGSVSFQGLGISAKAKWGAQSVSSGHLGAATTPKPSFAIRSGGQKGAVVVSGVDIMPTAALTGSAYTEGTIVASVLLHPRFIASGRLTEISGLYTRYRIKRLTLTWVPSNPLTTAAAAGEVMFSFERDPTQREAVGSVADYADLYSREGSVAGQEYACFSATYTPEGSGWYYVEDTSDPDPRLTYQGVCYLVAGQNIASTATGRTYVSYEVELIEPRTEHAVQNDVFRAVTGAITWTTLSSTLPLPATTKQSRHPWVSLRFVANDGVYLDVKAGWKGSVNFRIGAVQSGSLSIGAGGYWRWNLTNVSGTNTSFVDQRLSATENLTPTQTITSSTNFGGFTSWYVNATTDSTFYVSFQQAAVTNNACTLYTVVVEAFSFPTSYTAVQTPAGRISQRAKPEDFRLGPRDADPRAEDGWEGVCDSVADNQPDMAGRHHGRLPVQDDLAQRSLPRSLSSSSQASSTRR